MSNIANASVNVVYAYETEESLSLELDDEKNREVYGESKSSFLIGERAYLKFLSSSDTTYEIFSSIGSTRKEGTNIPYTVIENVVFKKEKTAALQKKPRSSVNYKWYGNAPGIPSFSGGSVSINQPAVAVLHCEYETLGDRISIIVNEEVDFGEKFDVVVVVVQGERKASTTITYSGDHIGPQPIDLKVVDFCGDEVVEGVEIYLDGESKGTTNSNGKIFLGELRPGTEHTLKMTKSGYVDSDKDVLYNDSFTVPTPDTTEEDIEDLKEEIERIEAKIEELQNS